MKDAKFAKFVLLVNCLVPLAMLGYDASQHRLGSNPVEYLIRTTGMLALIFLILSLAITPARKISGYNAFSHFRKMLGLCAFFYGLLHFASYFIFDRSLGIKSTIADTWARPFILLGMTALLVMVPLALTSTTGMIKRLGAARWKRLHRLAYMAGVAGALHYFLLVKADTRQPLVFAAVLTLLLGYRLVDGYLPSSRKGKPIVARPTPEVVRSESQA